MARKTTTFKPISEYLPEQSTLTIDQAYAEYTRLRRNVGYKRIKALEDFDTREYRENRWILDKPASAIPPNEIRQALLDMYKFTVSGRTTVTGAKAAQERAAKRLQELGYNLTPEQVPHFRDFMDRINARYGGRISSDRAAELYSEMAERGLVESQSNRDELLRNFEFYEENAGELGSAKRTRSGSFKATSLRKLREALED